MELAKVIKLIKEGEKYNIDFKIRCEAFRPNIKVITHKAELVKDICAMANNGNIASYIIVGVSDDGNIFESVSNPNLTDDVIQDFCKDSIFPPPKVKVFSIRWKRTEPRFANVEFVIIQIGPQRRQAFRLSRDFIDYKEKVCLRHNEVWLRRGATTDIATPEEIVRLVKGEPPIEDDDAIKKREERDEFQRLSLNAKLSRINHSSSNSLLNDHQYIIESKDTKGFGWYERERTPTTFYKLFDTFIMLVNLYRCRETLTKSELESYAFWRFELGTHKIDIPQPTLKRISNKDLSIRRLWIMPVISSVTPKRVQTVLGSWRWTGTYLHFFYPYYDRRGVATEPLETSSELLIIDHIKSISDFQDYFISAIKDIEKYTD